MTLAALTSSLHLAACTTREVIDHSLVVEDAGRDAHTDDAARSDAALDMSPDAPAATLPGELVIDGSVHTGRYRNGTPYVGVYGEVVTFRLADLPDLAPLALLHAPIMANRAGLSVTPEALIAHIVLRAGADCATSRPVGGCMELLRDPHLAELAALTPDQFDGVTSQALASPEAFGLGVASYLWRASYARAIFGDYTADVSGHIDGHPGAPGEAPRYRLFAHAFSPYDGDMPEVFEACSETELPDCLDAIGAVDTSRADLLRAATHIAIGLERAPRAALSITRAQADRYVASLAPLHVAPRADVDRVLDAHFPADAPLTSTERAAAMLEDLTDALGAPDSPDAIRGVLCRRSILDGPPACP